MSREFLAGAALGTALMAAVACAAQDEGPILTPKKPAGGGTTLLVMCDLACTWKLDGEAKGRIDAGGSVKAKVSPGDHVVIAATEDGLDKKEQDVKAERDSQTLVRLELNPVREARVEAERSATEQKELRDHADANNDAGLDAYNAGKFTDAQDYFDKSCRGGSARGCYNLGAIYDYGKGRNPDYAQARQLYEKACDGGNSSACNNLGRMYEQSHGVALDNNRARQLYMKSCGMSDTGGCTNLGWMYYSGYGGPQDYEQARAAFEKACDAVDSEPIGCRGLGILYDEANGVPQDYAKARELYERACNGGDNSGCHRLGVLYYYGRGVGQDNEKAKTLFKKACDGGLQVSCTSLNNIQ